MFLRFSHLRQQLSTGHLAGTSAIRCRFTPLQCAAPSTATTVPDPPGVAQVRRMDSARITSRSRNRTPGITVDMKVALSSDHQEKS